MALADISKLNTIFDYLYFRSRVKVPHKGNKVEIIIASLVFDGQNTFLEGKYSRILFNLIGVIDCI